MKTLELDITFGRDYLVRHFGLTFDRDYFEDVRVRVETDQAAARALHERFGDVGLGDPDPAPVMRLGYDDTLNTTLMFGAEPRMGGGVSWIEPGTLGADAIDGLQCPDVATTFPHTRFLRQFDRAVELYGPDSVRPPTPHGILEGALDLRGGAFLEDLLLAPARAERVLDVLTEAIITIKDFWDRKCFGEVRPGLSLGGCSTTMLSPEVVERFLVPRYSRIAGRFGDAFVCSCGLSTPNLENFATIQGVRYVRVGWGTDLARAATTLAGRHVKAGLSVVRAASLGPDEFEGDVRAALDCLEPIRHASLLLISAGADTKDANVRRLVDAATRLARERGIELRDTSSCLLRRRSGLTNETG